MNWFDIAILVVLAAFALKGLLRGLLKELCSLIGLVAGLYLALRFSTPLAAEMTQAFHLPQKLCSIVAFSLLFLATFAFFTVLGYLLSRFVKLVFLGGLNRVAGGLFGLVQGGLLLALALFTLSLSPLPKRVRPVFSRSQLAPPFVHFGAAVVHGGREILTDSPRTAAEE
ncbi:MAG TPA: CvpA family protein [Desulfuromonadales bacterium]|nr:CvpA family protein [Desulfuromonadales bacterium]